MVFDVVKTARKKEREKKRRGEKKNNHPFFPRIHPFSAYGLAALKNVEKRIRARTQNARVVPRSKWRGNWEPGQARNH